MSLAPSFRDNQPLGSLGRIPIYASTILTALYTVGLICSALMESAHVPLAPFAFNPVFFLKGAVWQLLTYSLIDRVNFFTPFSLLFFYSWSVEIEKHLGRAHYLKIFAMLVLLAPVLVVARWGLFGWPYAVSGNFLIVVGILIAFATLYPNIETWGWIPMKWFAFACIVCGSLMYFPDHDWFGLFLLWATCGAAFGYVHFVKMGGSTDFPRIPNPFRRRSKLRVLPDPVSSETRVEPDATEDIDMLLDKISKSGLASLTSRERAKLEKAREALIKKDPRRS